MKIQCSCGAKYEFEVTPEMARRPVRFICAACGVDASEFVDGLVRRELGQTTTPRGVPVPIQMSGASAVTAEELLPELPPPPQPARAAVAVRVAKAEPVQSPTTVEATVEGTPCLKHPGQVAVEKCYICSKPICPKCMELFGYVCSPLCKAKADSHGIEVPIYEGQRSVVEARQWRRIVWTSSIAGGVLAVLLGFWFWYAWFGSLPKPIFSVRFDQPAYSGHSIICGKDKDQIVFLHGGTLARYDMKTGKEVWSANLIDKKQIVDAIEKERQLTQKLIDKANNEAWENMPKMPSEEKLAQIMEREQAAALDLHVRGQNVWVASPGKLVRYDWDTGKVSKEVAVRSTEFGGLISRGDELTVVDREGAKPIVTSVNLDTCESRTEELGAPEATNLVANVGAGPTGKPKETAGLPTGVPGRDLGKPMDPSKVAQQFANLPYAAKLALPATLANTMTQERALKALDEENRRSFDVSGGPGSRFSLIPAPEGFVQFGVRLVEERMVSRSAMKAAPGKSALEGNVSAGKSMEVANEMLNEMQRERGGDVVQEDVSKYEVTVRKPGLDQVWKGQVIGPPKLYPLKTVNVIAANQSIIVLDKTNRMLWQSPLTFNVRDINALDENSGLYGQGPCVEQKGSLYVMDEGMLTAFDLATGKPLWRFQSVGIAGIFFDDNGNMYVNTTTASPDSIKYSQQIDISEHVISVIQKIDPRNGAVLWSYEPGGMISYVSGKFIYVVQSYTPDETDEENPYRVETGFEKGPFLHIRRINPSNGHPIWEHVQQRAPVDIAFDKNTIRLVFKKEVQVLKALTF